MKTRCPQCGAHYDVVPEALASVRGIVRCFICGTLFNVNDHTLPSTDENTTDIAKTPGNHAAHKIHWPKATLVFALLLLLGGQLGWHNRGQLLQLFPFKQLCSHMDCSAAQQYIPAYYSVTERYFAPDPEHSEALRLDISFRNNASYAQAYPILQISLYDIDELVVARRHLKPHQYMQPAPDKNQQIAAQEIVKVSLSLLDPGPHASGFRVNFL